MKYNGKIITVMVVICAMFLSLAVYLTYFTIVDSGELIENKFNKRIREREESILRGTIFDSKGEILAYSAMDGNRQKRYYPFKERYAHVIGYNSVTYDKSGLENTFNDILVKADPFEDISGFFSMNKEMPKGADLYLTIDNSLTAIAEKRMRGKNGAVVALRPKTGEVLCMYSNPSFDPNEEALSKNFALLTKSENAPFLGRAAQGLYPPGSTFKIITAAAAIEEGVAENIIDEGSVVIDGYPVENYNGKKLGEIDITKGFAASSNVMFASYGVKIGEKRLRAVAERFGIGERLDFDIRTSKSLFNYENRMGQTDLAAVGIGQGKLLVTPLNMALVASAIANDGVIMKPYIVDKALYSGGRQAYVSKPDVWKTAVSEAVAAMIENMMVECVNTGTGTGAQINGVTVAGKTGTAENEESDKTHAWFVCYAPAEDPEIAICVMQEYAGVTGSNCAPIARELIKYYLGK
ncbi:MAG: peptidoglycan glycosyltransferase [Clostridia bacterium]|nr:peptidoglycan glycosyltransferase [Clostridia bacterium]